MENLISLTFDVKRVTLLRRTCSNFMCWSDSPASLLSLAPYRRCYSTLLMSFHFLSQFGENSCRWNTICNTTHLTRWLLKPPINHTGVLKLRKFLQLISQSVWPSFHEPTHVYGQPNRLGALNKVERFTSNVSSSNFSIKRVPRPSWPWKGGVLDN